MKLRATILFLFVLKAASIHAQDPHFTQFYTSPLTVNPAYTGFFEDANWRVISNYRRQWVSQLSYINTNTIQIDGKFGKEDEEDRKPFGIGILFMNDVSMEEIGRAHV